MFRLSNSWLPVDVFLFVNYRVTFKIGITTHSFMQIVKMLVVIYTRQLRTRFEMPKEKPI